MKLPTIHMNGTSAGDLLEQNRAVLAAARALQEALAAATPNARDYYPQGSGAYTVARDEHRARLGNVQSIHDEIMEIAVHCSDAVTAKEARDAELSARYAAQK